MRAVTEQLAALGVRVPDLLVPRPEVDLQTWAVVACDQFTSQRDYWERAADLVGDAPSTLNLVFPEVYLEDSDATERIGRINAAMADYLDRDLLAGYPQSFFLVRRETARGAARWGLIVALDLEQYSWAKDARTLIRATEGTILDRLPPRVAVRREAALELPHIMVLLNDAARSVIEPLAAAVDRLPQAYDTALMLGGGRVAAWVVDGEDDLAAVASALTALHDQLDPADPLLFAMGDGNHSFATAKSIWEDVKAGLPPAEWAGHPARYCLVELENIFDPALEFEPIHRVLFGVTREAFEAELARHCASFERVEAAGLETLLEAIEDRDRQRFGCRDTDGFAVYTVQEPAASIAAGTLQRVIDSLLAADAGEVDYIHGADVTDHLGGRSGNLGLFLPSVSKETFFAAILADGALPRKTFSLGEAADKRYYLEGRLIR